MTFQTTACDTYKVELDILEVVSTKSIGIGMRTPPLWGLCIRFVFIEEKATSSCSGLAIDSNFVAWMTETTLVYIQSFGTNSITSWSSNTFRFSSRLLQGLFDQKYV